MPVTIEITRHTARGPVTHRTTLRAGMTAEAFFSGTAWRRQAGEPATWYRELADGTFETAQVVR